MSQPPMPPQSAPDPQAQPPQSGQGDPSVQSPPPAQSGPYAQQSPGAAPPQQSPYGSPGAGPQSPGASPNTGQQPGVVPGSPQQQFVGVNTVAGPVADYIEIPGKGVVQLASIGQRAIARILDSVILGIVLGVLIGVGTAIFAAAASSGSDEAILGGFGAFFGIMGLAIVIIYAYEAVMIGFWGATLGKMIMKIKVVKPTGGAVPGIGAGVVRYLIPGLAALIPFVGWLGTLFCFISASFDNSGRRQGWHDKVANTVVVTSKAG